MTKKKDQAKNDLSDNLNSVKKGESAMDVSSLIDMVSPEVIDGAMKNTESFKKLESEVESLNKVVLDTNSMIKSLVNKLQEQTNKISNDNSDSNKELTKDIPSVINPEEVDITPDDTKSEMSLIEEKTRLEEMKVLSDPNVVKTRVMLGLANQFNQVIPISKLFEGIASWLQSLGNRTFQQQGSSGSGGFDMEKLFGLMETVLDKTSNFQTKAVSNAFRASKITSGSSPDSEEQSISNDPASLAKSLIPVIESIVDKKIKSSNKE